jgi:hypothetical protein
MKKHFNRYAMWAKRNNSCLIVTFDENAGGTVHPVPRSWSVRGSGQGVTHRVDEPLHPAAHHEKAYELRPLARAHAARPLSEIWKK